MNKRFFIGLVSVLVIMNILTVVFYVGARNDVKKAELQLAERNQNIKVKNFMLVFIETVLIAPGEVSFENRLRLENDVRAIGDKELLQLWEKFVGSVDKAEAEVNLENLLAGLAKKI